MQKMFPFDFEKSQDRIHAKVQIQAAKDEFTFDYRHSLLRIRTCEKNLCK